MQCRRRLSARKLLQIRVPNEPNPPELYCETTAPQWIIFS
jgi:hypothetical protein